MSDALPTHDALMWPTLVAIDALGGSASITEISDEVISRSELSEEQQALLHNGGPQTKINYRLGWARSHLKLVGYLVNSSRGVWALTQAGDELLRMGEPQGPTVLREAWRAAFRRLKSGPGEAEGEVSDARTAPVRAGSQESVTELGQEDDSGWRDQLLELLLNLEPAAFERLAQRLLREADFASVTVTGKTGDGGIDGVGKYRLSLISFPVFFQCKRYRGSVGAGAVRDFRGAMAGRGDKGLIITTGTFTAAAKLESSRDGATVIDLIDGSALCDLLLRYDLGARKEVRTVEVVKVDGDFFGTL